MTSRTNNVRRASRLSRRWRHCCERWEPTEPGRAGPGRLARPQRKACANSARLIIPSPLPPPRHINSCFCCRAHPLNRCVSACLSMARREGVKHASVAPQWYDNISVASAMLIHQTPSVLEAAGPAKKMIDVYILGSRKSRNQGSIGPMVEGSHLFATVHAVLGTHMHMRVPAGSVAQGEARKGLTPMIGRGRLLRVLKGRAIHTAGLEQCEHSQLRFAHIRYPPFPLPQEKLAGCGGGTVERLEGRHRSAHGLRETGISCKRPPQFCALRT